MGLIPAENLVHPEERRGPHSKYRTGPARATATVDGDGWGEGGRDRGTWYLTEDGGYNGRPHQGRVWGDSSIRRKPQAKVSGIIISGSQEDGIALLSHTVLRAPLGSSAGGSDRAISIEAGPYKISAEWLMPCQEVDGTNRGGYRCHAESKAEKTDRETLVPSRASKQRRGHGR